jgi:glutamate/tyrosine decarboxylase-like PLP-dependent enzyme
VISTAGTTNTGAVDDLVRLAAVCKEHGVWLHIDACFGGFFHITQRGRAFLNGIEAADSISLDAHKSFFMPHGISAFLVKERNTLKKTFQITAEYLSGFSKDELHVDFCQVGPELTREVRGLTVWLPMKMHGLKAFEHTLDHKLDLAHQLLADLRAIPEIKVIQNHALNLPVVNFKVIAASDAESAQKTKDICELICSYGNVFICTTELPDAGCVLRVCILHHLTDEKMIALLLGDIHRALKVVNERK